MQLKDVTSRTGTVTVKGWVEQKRDLGGIQFLVLRDSTAKLQIVIKNNSNNSNNIDISTIVKETVIEVTGEVQETDKTSLGVELVAENIQILSKSEDVLPINKESSLSKRLDWRSLSLRSQKSQDILHVQQRIVKSMRKYLESNRFSEVFTPGMLGVASESGSDVFPVIYFNGEAFLRQDPQLHRQLTIAGGHERIYEIGPAWRAEQSNTTKHLCEHRVCAVETAFIQNEYDVIRLEEHLVRHVIKKVKEEEKEPLNRLDVCINVPDESFPVLEFPEVYDILEDRGVDVKRGEDLDTPAERELRRHVKEEYGSDFYFVNKFPSKIKPFYVMKEENSPYARSVDLYYKDKELSSGGQREHRHSKIIEAVEQDGVEDIEWFSDPFRYGVPPHGGFALGIERLTQSLLDIENIRDCTYFPRDPDRLVP